MGRTRCAIRGGCRRASAARAVFTAGWGYSGRRAAAGAEPAADPGFSGAAGEAADYLGQAVACRGLDAEHAAVASTRR